MKRQLGTQPRDRRQPVAHERPVYVVFDDRHVMAPRDIDERHPAREAHRRHGRVLQVRHDEDRLDGCALADPFDLVGQQAVVVGRRADDLELEHRRERLQAVIREAVGDDHALGADQAVQYRIEPVLRAARDDHLVARRREARCGEPLRAGRACPVGPLRRLVFLQRRETRVGRQLTERPGEIRQELARRRTVHRQIDHAVARRERRPGRLDARHRAAGDERAAPLAADHEAPQLQLLVRTRYGRHVDAELGRELALRRQAATRRVHAVADFRLDRAGYLDIGRPLRLRRHAVASLSENFVCCHVSPMPTQKAFVCHLNLSGDCSRHPRTIKHLPKRQLNQRVGIG
ncbi:hypothetical protein BamMEX5DRAFT_6069 [Burkholderia ambifaria MEX-5]|uniref:Uncharacterized protein n=1 Tax=Burkholderia ambifaria MEX-5 TaxID=396597 RepID=B1TE53_9BURK|nr:hypothetical protein BamMEX5DRAFT_6069 [Burkholderia ambifaria MEX-5]